MSDAMPSSVFVFGSNRRGIHGRGAALHARMHHGAVQGQGEGLQGRAYAIPTKETPYRSLALVEIERHVATFLAFAASHPRTRFQVTAIGTGLAGHAVEDIAPMFKAAPGNCILPQEFVEHCARQMPPESDPT